MLDGERLPDRGAHRRNELEHRGPAATRDVEDIRFGVGGCECCPRYVANVHVIADLGSISEDRRHLTARHLFQKDRDDARLAVWILAWPVDVSVADDDVFRMV